MIIQPTSVLPNPTGQTFLTIGVILPDGRTPISMFRSMNVGVGGKYTSCTIAAGEPVRRATLNELRRKDRMVLAEYLRQYPTGQAFARRSRH